VPSPNPGADDNLLAAVSALSSNDVWAVGYKGGFPYDLLILHWNGTAWSESPAPEPNLNSTLYGVTAIAPNDVWAVGAQDDGQIQSTLIMHWDGIEWKEVAAPNPGGVLNILLGVDAIAADDVWAVGYRRTASLDIWTLTVHWDGQSWSEVPSPNVGTTANTLQEVSVLSSNDVWAVGFSGAFPARSTLTMRWDGAQWSVVPSPNVGTDQNVLTGVSATAAGNVWAVGYYGQYPTLQAMTQRWDGLVWNLVPAPSPGQNSPLFGVLSLPSGTAWAVGEAGTDTASGTLTMRYGGTCATATPTSFVSTPTPTAQATITVTATPTQCTLSFNDVPPESTFYPFIRCLACRGIVSGYADGTFRPNNPVTRGQLAKIVSNAAGFGDDPGPPIYEDVPTQQTFYIWINRLSHRGIMSGYPCGGPGEPCGPLRLPYFRPGAEATRGQTSKIVANAANLGGDPTGQTYEDVPPTHPFYVWIERLTALGVMSGYQCGGQGEACNPPQNRPYFRPQNSVTRGQSSKIVANTFVPGCGK
jgi:hypothetical protein